MILHGIKIFETIIIKKSFFKKSEKGVKKPGYFYRYKKVNVNDAALYLQKYFYIEDHLTPAIYETAYNDRVLFLCQYNPGPGFFQSKCRRGYWQYRNKI
jgi:hypothetical protein